MSCPYCGSTQCGNLCRQQMAQGLNQAQYQGQLSQSLAGLQGQINSYHQQIGNRLQQNNREQELEFLDAIDGKSDQEIAVDYCEAQAAYKKEQEEYIMNHIVTKRAKFLEMCKRFRPGVTEDLLKRVDKLKLFW